MCTCKKLLTQLEINHNIHHSSLTCFKKPRIVGWHISVNSLVPALWTILFCQTVQKSFQPPGICNTCLQTKLNYKILKHTIKSKTVIFYSRYVNEIPYSLIIYGEHKVHSGRVPNQFNNIHKALKFKSTLYKNKSITVLDSMIGYSSNHLKLDIHREPTATYYITQTFCDVTLCNWLRLSWHFKGTSTPHTFPYSLHK